jgi:acid phosphatase (class A)
MKNYKEFITEKESPYSDETLQKYKKEYEDGKEIPFGVRTSLIAQGMIPHEGGPDKGKKKKTDLYEAQMGVTDEGIDVNSVQYGNPPMELFEISQKADDPIKNWFIEKGICERMRATAPANDSETTKKDLETLVKLTAEATAEEITFARYVDDVSNLAQSFIDLLKENGYEEDMGGYFRIDSQPDGILYFLKDIINRPRPYQLAKCCNYPLYPLIRTDAMTAAYPSGHALTGFVMSEYYSRKYPKIKKELKDLGERVARSREVTGIHYPSDTQISREICNIIFENNLLQG